MSSTFWLLTLSPSLFQYQAMGWTEGSGLGKAGQGIVDPIEVGTISTISLSCIAGQ